MATNDTAEHEAILRKTLGIAAGMTLQTTPPELGAFIHRIVREISGNVDPYADAKRRSNELALGLYEDLLRDVRRADDPFEMAVRFAIAGNIIDFGPTSTLSENQVHEAVDDCRRARIDSAALEALREASRRSRRKLYIGDNAGEIVFDMLLVDQFSTGSVTFAVRGSAVINDATMADAVRVGMTDLVRVVDSGCDVPGTVLEHCSPEFREVFREADLVIAKGQGNYETLSDTDQPIAFLFKAKCPVIAEDMGCSIGDAVIAMEWNMNARRRVASIGEENRQ
jgi:uncharacterized protein with ATP-grasp and redox domains